ncbi:hypothetical protein C8Q80DRAFT_487574 [Daedaleopsis nitida]|nr:hypothetical protein C8Q80DRAFT_487574 [Daedaleopsis nitida]
MDGLAELWEPSDIPEVEEWKDIMENLGINPRDPRRPTPQGEFKMPKFIKFHLLDGGQNLDDIFWEEPLTFKPRAGRNGWIELWGVYPVSSILAHPSVSLFKCLLSNTANTLHWFCIQYDKLGIPYAEERQLKRVMSMQWIYLKGEMKGELKRPELQFIDALVARKVRQLEEDDLGDLRRRDYTLNISLPGLKDPRNNKVDRFWRRIRVSGGLPLGVFADKIITPLWGWVRNLHCHVFTDFKDGSLFGPKECNSVDVGHFYTSGYTYIPEEEYCIAHILRDSGEVMGYRYDFGDHWYVDIKVEEICPADQSNGKISLIDGAGGILPDGGSGSFGTSDWAINLRIADISEAGKRKLVSQVFGATNFSDKVQPRDPLTYDFDAFNIEGTRLVILDSKASLPYASKKAVSPVGEHTVESLMKNENVSSIGRNPKDLKKGTSVVRTKVDDTVFWEEGQSTVRRDNPKNTACASCGSPQDLKTCAKCGQRFYCSRECQTAHWKEKHKRDCKKPTRS